MLNVKDPATLDWCRTIDRLRRRVLATQNQFEKLADEWDGWVVPSRAAQEVFRCVVDEERRGVRAGRVGVFDRFEDKDKWLMFGEHPLFTHATKETFDMYPEDESCWDESEEPTFIAGAAKDTALGDIEEKLDQMAIDEQAKRPDV